MDMYQKREQRKNNKGPEKGLAHTHINWYPGHMVTAQNEIKESLKLIDIVVEVLDARIPKSSQNPIIDKLATDKARIVVLNKADLADRSSLDKWKKYFNEKDIVCINTNASIAENINKLIETIKVEGAKIYKEKYKNKTIEIKPIYRVLIVGIPNVGKSTIINKIANKNVANVGNKPGVTRKKQWIRVAQNIDLLDTPGLLWPKFDDPKTGINLALTGNIKQDILDLEEIAIEGIKSLISNEKYTNMFAEKYKFTKEEVSLEAYEILELIGKKKGCLVSGGNINLEKAANLFLEDFKSGKIGKISLE